jgi:ribosome biogenesis GTPase
VEFAEYIHHCKFNTCIHEHEPGCAVVKAVEEGKISLERYESYLNLLNTIEDDMFY